jgi:hypothetical protein
MESDDIEFHPHAHKHGVAESDIVHAITHAIAVVSQTDSRRLYLGPARGASLLEVVTVLRLRRAELVIHAMAMQRKYRDLLPKDQSQ